MNDRRRTGSCSWLYLCAVAWVLSLSAGDFAHAQTNTNLAANCSTNPNMPSSTTLPVNSASTNPGLNNVDTTSCGINQANQDGLKCFTPQNSCTVTVTGKGGPNPLNTRVGIAAGPCSTTPASCTGSGSSNSLTVALTAGTQYCIYVETTTSQLIGYDLTVFSGNCGTLPVELMGFSVDSGATE